MVKQLINNERGIIPKYYTEFFAEIKERIRTSQIKAALSVNRELIKLYWDIGTSVHQKQKKEGWGAKIIGKLAKDLKSAFPNMKGFSLRNLQYMVKFAREYPEISIVQQPVAQIPWGHNALLLDKLKDLDSRIWYAQKTIENGWSRNVLSHWIDISLYERQGKAITNFQATLPAPQSDLAHQILKNPYCFDFLTLREKFDEKELEDGLLNHIQKFLLELGQGFAFVGRQYRIEVDETDYFLDLLFYHLKLRCYCVIELKSTVFKPEDAGKMNFYLSAVDDFLRHPSDNPSIGMILCKHNKKFTVEYALRDINKPIGVSGYETQIIESLPENLKGSLPTIEEIEQNLDLEKAWKRASYEEKSDKVEQFVDDAVEKMKKQPHVERSASKY